jgi:putative PIN family toxin of toxin-antitoxin system
MKPHKPRVVFDTNIYISALFGGNPEKVWGLVQSGQISLLTTPLILAELAAKLRLKFRTPETEIIQYLNEILYYAELVRPATRLHVVSDEPDNRVLECAVAGKASTIVSGDGHLLALHVYRKIDILRPADFLRRLGVLR